MVNICLKLLIGGGRLQYELSALEISDKVYPILYLLS